MYPLQRRYIEAAHASVIKDKVFINIEDDFIHCDNQNVPKSILQFVYWLGKIFEFNTLVLALRCYKKVVTCLLNGKKQLTICENTISVEGIKSHLAKRYKTANPNRMATNKLSILILIYDQLIFNEKIKQLRKKYDEAIDTIVIFNGRVSPENLADKLWIGPVEYVEQGFGEAFYYGGYLPVSKKRWECEFQNIVASVSPIKKRPAPKKVVLFLTSPYEFMFADEDFHPSTGDFQSQYEVLKTFVKICDELNLTALVKFHPRNPRANFLNDHSLEKFTFDFVETNANAADLIEISDVVVLSSSSLAIDSALANKPNCHCLPAFYENASISHPAKDETALRNFMTSPFILETASIRANILRERFEQSASGLDEKPSFTRYIKKLILGH